MKLRDLITTMEPDRRVWVVLVQDFHDDDKFAVVLVDGMPPVGPLAWTRWYIRDEEGMPFNLQDAARNALARRLVNGMPTSLLDAWTVTTVQFTHPAAVAVAEEST